MSHRSAEVGDSVLVWWLQGHRGPGLLLAFCSQFNFLVRGFLPAGTSLSKMVPELLLRLLLASGHTVPRSHVNSNVDDDLCKAQLR